MKILFIGGGNMTNAIVSGLIKNDFKPSSITVIDRHEEKQKDLTKQYGVNCATSADNFIAQSDVVFLAIKPQGSRETLELFKPLFKNQLVVSVMAGISMSSLQTWLGENLPIVRAMPNSPSKIQMGATGLFANQFVNSEHKKQTEQLLTSIGIIAWLDEEKHIDTIIALSGSAPAYFFLMMEIMTKVAVKMGLPETMAKDFAIQAGRGSTQLAHQSSESLETLRAAVTSKKGTTEAAITAMKENGLEEALSAGMWAAAKRSEELATS